MIIKNNKKIQKSFYKNKVYARNINKIKVDVKYLHKIIDY